VSEVAAIVIGPQPERAHALTGDRAAEVATAPSLGDLPDLARTVRAPLLWLLDSGATPREGALDALLEQAYDPAVSLPVDELDSPVEPVLGRFTESDRHGMLEAVSRCRVPLRHTFVVSLLIRREVVLEHPPPDPARFGRYAGTEWTARVFAGKPGMLIPASRVRVGSSAPGALQHALRMARTGVWRRGETLRELQRALLAAR
jgi:hypothetical protein